MTQPWLRHYPTGLGASLDYPSIPLYRFLQDSARRFPSRVAIISFDGESGRETEAKSYRALDDESSRLAAALAELGVGKGDRVAYYLQNSPSLVVSFYAILKAGAVPVPCNPMYQSDELTHQLGDCGASTIVCDAQSLLVVEQVREQVREHIGLERVVVADVADVPRHAYSMNDLIAQHLPLEPLSDITPEEDLALLPYTGGTTGVPKGAMLTHANLVANAIQFSRWFDYRPGEETFIAVLPLSHIGGIAGVMSVPIAVGGTIILFRRFHPQGVFQAIEGYRATRFLGVPTMYINLLGQPDSGQYDLSSLGPSRTSAAPLPEAVKESFDKLVGREVLIEGYGLTETSPLTHVNPPQRALLGSMGVPLPDTDARVVDPDDRTKVLTAGEIGELALRGPQVMRGYWNRPDATAEVMLDGWFHTGDLARMDGDGYFYIVDRIKDVINAAGFKVWPREVEEVLYRHPLVHMAAVAGTADPYRGETVKATIVLKDTASDSQDTIRDALTAHCRSQLAAYKVPRIIEFRDSLPVSSAGKVLRRELR